MKSISKTSVLSVAMCFWFASLLYGQLYTFETRNLNLIYVNKTHEYIVPHLARCFENALQFERGLFHYTPTQKVTVFLQDFSDFGNGGATSVPRNFIQMNLSPVDFVFETSPANERMNWMMNHELVHIVTTDQAAGSDAFFRSLFLGKAWTAEDNPASTLYSYLTNPRKLSPRWYLEGIAVFLETWMAGGLGRAQGAYDEMVFRSMVCDSSYFYDVVGLESEGTTIDFQVGANAYLYGTRFLSYLAYVHGPETLLQWTTRSKGSKRYFASQFKNVYGTSLDAEWSRWILWEHQWQKANLDSIRKYPTTPSRSILTRALGSVSRGFYDSAQKKLFVAVLYPGQVAHIAAIRIDTGAIEKLCEVKGPALYEVASLAYDPSSGTVFYTTDNSRWRDLNALDIKTGKSKRLMQDARTGDLAFNRTDRSLWGVRHFNGISTLVRIPYPYHAWNQIYSFPYGKDIFDLDVSPDGSVITAALVEISGKQQLIKMDIAQLTKNDAPYEILYDFENNLPENFVFSPDGRFLYGSSYYSGVSNVYRYDFENKSMEILSNCESGFFRPLPVSKDSLIVMRYTGKGFLPVVIPVQRPEQVGAVQFLGNAIAVKHPIVKTWMLGSPARIPIDSLKTYSGQYNPVRRVRLDSAYPVVEGYKDVAAVGYRLNFSDLLGLSNGHLTVSYSPDPDLPADERVHLGLDFNWWQWNVSASYNGANFFDLAGPTKTSRKGYSLALQYKKSLVYDQPKTLDFNFRIAGYGGLERLPDYQNVASPFGQFLSMRANLDYRYYRKSLGAVDDEKGIGGQVISQNVYVRSKMFPRIIANVNYGIPLAMNHSSIWLRSSAGYSFGDAGDPFANFFFGGFGNNWLDDLTEKRYREYFSFPGTALNAFGGRNYGKAMLEWNLPPIRFRRVGFTGFYFRWARPALFASGIRTNFERREGFKPLPQYGAGRTLFNLGAQVDFRMVLFSRFDSTVSLGYAVAHEKQTGRSNEFMVSLKIL